MPQVSISRSALRELRERMSSYECPTGVRIMGPFEEDSRAPDSVEEAWLLEKLYGPPQRWVLEIVPLEEFQDEDMESSEHLHVGEFKGIPVGVLTSKPVQRLHIELNGDAIRVFELDA
jgi:hypothetical protein